MRSVTVKDIDSNVINIEVVSLRSLTDEFTGEEKKNENCLGIPKS